MSRHPALWSCSLALEFITDISNFIENKPKRLKEKLDYHCRGNFEGTWERLLDPLLWTTLQQKRSYDPNSFTDLLRVIRNLAGHLYDLQLKEQKTFAVFGNHDNLWPYFSTRFTHLLLNVWKGVKELDLMKELSHQY